MNGRRGVGLPATSACVGKRLGFDSYLGGRSSKAIKLSLEAARGLLSINEAALRRVASDRSSVVYWLIRRCALDAAPKLIGRLPQ